MTAPWLHVKDLVLLCFCNCGGFSVSGSVWEFISHWRLVGSTELGIWTPMTWDSVKLKVSSGTNVPFGEVPLALNPLNCNMPKSSPMRYAFEHRRMTARRYEYGFEWDLYIFNLVGKENTGVWKKIVLPCTGKIMNNFLLKRVAGNWCDPFSFNACLWVYISMLCE